MMGIYRPKRIQPLKNCSWETTCFSRYNVFGRRFFKKWHMAWEDEGPKAGQSHSLEGNASLPYFVYVSKLCCLHGCVHTPKFSLQEWRIFQVLSEWRSREAIDFPRSIARWSTRLSEDLDEICRQHSAELQRRVADLASGEGRSGNANRETQTSFPKVSYCARVCSHVYFIYTCMIT